MTDEQIIKALECCNRPTSEGRCKGCPYYKIDGRCTAILLDETINLINRQKAEIESLKHRKTELQIRNQELQHEKSEAIKEFAERLKHFIIPQKADGYTREIVLKIDIDNLVKEMTEEKE